MLSMLTVVEGAGGKPVTCSILVTVNYFRQIYFYSLRAHTAWSKFILITQY